MKDLLLERFSYAATETEGTLRVGDYLLSTLERPWVPHLFPGGRPFESCVPDGDYLLQLWTRPDGSEAFILSNSDLGVYRLESDIPAGVEARYLILVHVANFVDDIVGCIAPGMHRSLMVNPETGSMERAVKSSGEAMRVLKRVLGIGDHTLTIRPKCGTKEVS